MKTAYTFVIVAGGTGGHIFPGLSVANEIRSRGYHVIWVGNRKGMESIIVPKHGISMEFLCFQGVRCRGWIAWFVLPFTLIKAFISSLFLLRRSEADVVLVMGGYLSVPVGLASFFLKKPLIVHEQNAYAGLANRFLRFFAERVLTAFPNVLKTGENVGNPVAMCFLNTEFPEKRYIARGMQPLKIFVIGGSLGSMFLNELLPKALALLPVANRPCVFHQTGAKHIETVRLDYIAHKVLDKKKVKLIPFVQDMLSVYLASDLIICRAGAMTVSEIIEVGVAALFVPYPFAVDDHQTKNAQCLIKAQAADLMLQHELNPEKLAHYLMNLTRTSLAKKAQCARKLARASAAQSIADICIAAAKSRKYS